MTEPTDEPTPGARSLPAPDTALPRLVVVTGLSGSGKSTVGKCFEDLGYYTVDNLPLSLLQQLLEDPLAHVEEHRDVAVVTDVRAAGFASEFPAMFRGVDRRAVSPTLLFLEANDETLLRRFSETRRPHPLTADLPLPEALAREKEILAELRGMADMVFDTSQWTIHEIRAKVYHAFSTYARTGPGVMQVSLVSFGFKYGIPLGSDLLFDVRFLPNPYFVEGLRPLTGLDEPVTAYLDGESDFRDLVDRLSDLLLYLLPRYRSENRSYLSVAIGCTGGRHRSVAIVERLQERLRESGWEPRVRHRDVQR